MSKAKKIAKLTRALKATQQSEKSDFSIASTSNIEILINRYLGNTYTNYQTWQFPHGFFQRQDFYHSRSVDIRIVALNKEIKICIGIFDNYDHFISGFISDAGVLIQSDSEVEAQSEAARKKVEMIIIVNTIEDLTRVLGKIENMNLFVDYHSDSKISVMH